MSKHTAPPIKLNNYVTPYVVICYLIHVKGMGVKGAGRLILLFQV
jgi:hypothetical protein